MSKAILLKGGRYTDGRITVRRDILIKDGSIAAEGACCDDATVIDISGMTVAPAFVDLHVHFREPGFPSKETIATGSQAGAAGGYTCVCTMPNLMPVPDSLENLKLEQEIIDRDATIDVLPYCTITKGRQGKELVDFSSLKNVCVAFSDDGNGVQDDCIMLEAMLKAAEENVIIAAHCEVDRLLNGGYIHDGQYCRSNGHKGICSESEYAQIARDIELSRQTGCRYHVCHISTKESVELIRKAKASGVRISCETGPHYLSLCQDDLQDDGRFKMNPPLRNSDDRQALIEGFIDGTIDVIATDHAPHTAEQKSRGLAGSAMGIVGLETSFPVLYTDLVRTGICSLEHLIEAMSCRPREIFNLEPAPADLVVLDLDRKWTIDSSRFKSMGHSTPFEGKEVFGKVVMTIKEGKIIYSENQ